MKWMIAVVFLVVVVVVSAIMVDSEVEESTESVHLYSQYFHTVRHIAKFNIASDCEKYRSQSFQTDDYATRFCSNKSDLSTNLK
ncbi:hypothetical protein D8682_06145 [Buttiauxella sp. 3AFRM03]|jgi:hypothetical protein|uniref:hypothetical protein n=1 Tax=Buttiauxella TaxID=82976 RepID=UPI0007E35996|nr:MULTISPECIES: hypothetical protein [Buttiauxella]AYN26601.1 hypothetical protein D8682_06145 [Buttiauxella sp. 3AFRM03]MCE0826844.1 hypothetical protein [Buttiauxella ferragutiae]TDN54885.1 hypothetical protein EC843_101944 [Buttiauxella sp. JUb87]UNK62996.1 hypothetical protein MNO13_08775 [Buttiauxella ferragutiae]